MNFEKRGNKESLHSVSHELAYPDGKEISGNKKKDLEKMQHIIPQQAKSFYDKILGRGVTDDVEDVDGLSACDFFFDESYLEDE